MIRVRASVRFEDDVFTITDTNTATGAVTVTVTVISMVTI